MVAVAIPDVQMALEQALELRGFSGTAKAALVADFLGPQIEGVTTHGLGRFLLLDDALKARQGPAQIIRDSGSCVLVDGHGELGPVAATLAIELLIPRARSAGIAAVAVRNISRYGRLSPYGRAIAEAGLAGIVLNGAGPAGVVPSGGIDPVLGTNPICFAFPMGKGQLVIDFTTAAKPWGAIRQAILRGDPLPEGVFIDGNGLFTRDPSEANAVLPFGGHRGYALCLALEVLGGALVGAKMGLRVDNERDLGCLFMALDPAAFGTEDSISGEIEDLAASIRHSRPKDASSPPRVPGDGSQDRGRRAREAGIIEVDQETWDRLRAMSRELGAGLESTHATN